MRQNIEHDLSKEDIFRMIVKHLDVFPLTCLDAIREVIRSSLKQRGLIGGVTKQTGAAAITYNRKISEKDIQLINDCIYDLLYSRVIQPGINNDNRDLPWIHVSDKEKLKKYLN
ncbi:hypothetical protein OKW24_003916 [Peribacillus simplex]|uniref:Uncharacterized protein n=1 Tax=Peribacillus simplex TaxID=1478 RepID=A0AAW7IVL5_9BACI|nr:MULTISPECIES: hypothetical protein [Peribacillus]SNT51252.1 hypothetical protein SAMN05444672_1373 [Bacillus sp. OK838]MDF9762143.1 hypothetical protein [Peribacillus simplex]MDM5454227.1 hypothetical protein [Peribacillus simplex]MDV7766851.1 hypothetical protein [Peribacillus sp. CSMR9]MDW7616555.1 hypothetical protein [Peribacillus simplex]